MATERENFETWIAEGGGDLQTFGSGQNTHYRNSAVNNAWVAWSRRAALAAPPVEQPEAAPSVSEADITASREHIADVHNAEQLRSALGQLRREVVIELAARGFVPSFYGTAQSAPPVEQQAAAVMVDCVPPATSRDKWFYEQGRLAERDPRTRAMESKQPAPQAGAAEQTSWAEKLDGLDVFLKGWKRSEPCLKNGMEKRVGQWIEGLAAHPTPSHMAVMQQALDALKKARWDSLNMPRSDMLEIQAAIAALSATMEKPNGK